MTSTFPARSFRSVTVSAAGGALELLSVPVTEPAPGQVRVTVEASGICHTDRAIVDGVFGDVFPLVPGHEVAGRVDVVGPGVTGWTPGDRVAIGWCGGTCGECAACRAGRTMECAQLRTPSLAYPGGHADAITVPAGGLARIPDGMAATQAAAMGCAGVTVYTALRDADARPGALVAVLGLGGLGHLGVQFAAKLGYRVAVVARGREKEALARELGAIDYVDSETGDVAAALQALGGADAVLATAANSAAMTAAFGGLAPRGELIVIGGAAEPLLISPYELLVGSRRIRGSAAGTVADVEETMRFAVLTGVRTLVEELPLDRAAEAYERMLSGAARFRMVLTTGN